MQHVTDIQVSNRRPKTVVIEIDGESWRVLPLAVFRELKLTVGDACDLRDIEERVTEAEARCARQRALGLLARRERSATDVSSRMLADGYAPGIVRQVVGDLERVGILSDTRCAEALGDSLVRVRGLGRKRARYEMLRRGIAAELADAVLDELAPVELEVDRARARLSLLQHRGLSGDALLRKLVALGYASADALRAVREHEAECED